MFLKQRFLAYKKRINEIYKIITIKQILDFFFFPIIAIISLLLKPYCKDIWIIGENPNEACDNGYIFFKYIRENRKDINAYYVINKKSKDYQKVKEYGNIIQNRSLKHWIFYLNASKIIVTQKYSNPSSALFYILHTKKILKIPRIFLQHGIIKDDGKMFYYNRTNFRLFICGAKREYEYIKEKFGYPEKNIAYTGLARYDNLDISKNTQNNIVLIAPTWRKWINNQKDFDSFMLNYYEILNNEELQELLQEKNLQLKLVLHKNMNKFKIKFESTNDNVNINHNNEVDIQKILNQTTMLVTDFSSIYFDIAYRKRPIIYFQFDTEKYRQTQLEEGYFSYKNDGFGEIIKASNEVVKKIEYYIKNNFKIENIYLERMNNFFERKDKENCKRILEEIEKIDG